MPSSEKNSHKSDLDLLVTFPVFSDFFCGRHGENAITIKRVIHMIKEILHDNISDLNKLDGIISSYFRFIKEKYNRTEYPLKERLRKGLTDSTMAIFVANDESSTPIGFSIAHKTEGRLSIILGNMDEKVVDESINMNAKALFDSAYDYLKAEHNIIKIGGDLSSSLQAHALNMGFTDYKRARMFINRDVVLNLREDDLPVNFSFIPWKVEMLETIADLMAKDHFYPNHPDGYVFSQYGGFNGCKKLLEEISKNTFGEFHDEYTRILKYKDELVGMCSITKLGNNVGYIPEIILSRDYTRKGLGKALLIHSLKHFVNKEKASPKIELDVTLFNEKAANLYESIGFESINTYSVLIWNKN